MPVSELIPVLQALPRSEKLRVVRFLIDELAQEDGIASEHVACSHAVWSPYDAFEAAATLLQALEDEVPNS